MALNKITITGSVVDDEGGLIVSVQTNDTIEGPHRFDVAVGKRPYEALPKGTVGQLALKGLVKPNVISQHTAWLARKSIESAKRRDVPTLFGDDDIAL